MVGESGNKDKKDARALAIVLILLVAVLAVTAVFAMPALAEFSALYLAPGLGLRDAAIIAFVVTIAVLVVFAIAAGDGLLGEIQFMLLGFFAFFVMLWLMIAWVF
ncbi:hypothetical protein PHACT_04885 [Pseudohongiella acticola]|jgi:hypothetical protein|uniref:Uncharacterized protein n=1 Tax=Pseudohongiella acticola TaxID=1524254 RepID=A0A1E8CJS4_9GAMM|nr:hypothetical protein [Pseudohongiella acticola]OFE12552.1 hypothetical protein PHACT_04885 [Pseudohongiella acticola]